MRIHDLLLAMPGSLPGCASGLSGAIPHLHDDVCVEWNFPTGSVSIMGLVSLQAFYLPFAMLALSLVMGGDWMSDLLGILAGHL